MTAPYDPATIAFYDAEASAYADASRRSGHLDGFIARLAPGARVLELGCGAGFDSESLLAAGFDVTATDASSKLAAIASARIGRPVRVMRSDELPEAGAYDGVWANACLLHVPVAALPDILMRIFNSLRPGGVFFASFKSGEGEGRDGLGRFYNFIGRAALEGCYRRAGDWSSLAFEEGVGRGYDGVQTPWVSCTAVR